MREAKAMFVAPGGGFDAVQAEQITVAEPRAHEITVRLHANSLNYHDYAVVSGMWGPAEKRIPMADGAGEIVAVGAQVSEFKAGDRVVSTFFPSWLSGKPIVEGFATVPGDGVDGYACEYVTAASTAFTKAPAGWTHVEAATLTTAGLTAWRALMCFSPLKPGDTVLVQGSGGVSIFALQFAKMMGARVIATTSNKAKMEQLKGMGADYVLNYITQPNWGEIARELTGGIGVEHVIDVGGAETLDQSLDAVCVGGQVLVIGILSGLTCQMNIVKALIKQVKMQGVLVGSRAQQQDMIKAIEANTMKPIIDKTFALEDIVAAFKYQESNRHFGKICLEF